MFHTNVDFYGVGFDDKGFRVIARICDFNPEKSRNKEKVETLLSEIEQTENVAVAEIVDADTYNKYLNSGCIRDAKTGQPVTYVPPEPTAEEIATNKQAALDAEYTSAQQALGQSLLVANLNGDTDTAESIQSEFADLTAYYKEQSGAIAAELVAATEGSDK